MPILESNQQRAALLVWLLAAGVLFALAPYATGLIGGLVLYVVFAPIHGLLARRFHHGVSAGLVVLIVLLLLVLVGVPLLGLLVSQAQGMAASALRGPLVERLTQLRIGGVDVGAQLAGLGEQLVSWLGASALGVIGTATRFALNLTISMFILYYLLTNASRAWAAVRPYIPFSAANAELLKERFRDVTVSTVIGTGLIACIQGALVAVGFTLTGLPNAAFWGVVTVIFAILPVVGSGLVWGPGVLSLLLAERYVAGGILLALGVLVVGNVDVVIRPVVFRRYASIHPLVTLVGAIAGVGYFGLLGLLVGPLAISYFFELIRMYREEYLPK